MKSVKIDAFFSCSFKDADKDLNDFFSAICSALDISPSNVSHGSPRTPPEEAKKQIGDAQALIAICTCRDELKSGGFHMPQAVHDEISFAFGIDTPVLIFYEEGVELSGFKPNFSTFQEFNRDKLTSPEFVEKAIKSVHTLKLDVLGPHQVGINQGMSDAIADFVNYSVELINVGDSFEWQYASSKKLVFQHESKRRFPTQVWVEGASRVPPDAPPISWNCELQSSSSGIALETEIEEHTAVAVRALLRPTPHPQKDDFVEFFTTFRSPYLNMLWANESDEIRPIHLEDRDYQCVDGLVFIHRTKKATIEFRFSRDYPIARNKMRPFVASYTTEIDYEVPTEMERVTLTEDTFAGSIVIKMEVESPLPGHMYGLAWDPPEKPDQ